MPKKHKVFISFHHGDKSDKKRGQIWKDKFVKLMTEYTDGMVDKSVNDGDIGKDLKAEKIRQKIRENYLADSTVTVVLIGPDTWKRKHVDWEIASSLRSTSNSSRSGLLGILLPTHKGFGSEKIDGYTIPPRLTDNVIGDDPFANVYHWTDDPSALQNYIHRAFKRRDQDPPPKNSRPMFSKNRPSNHKKWTK